MIKRILIYAGILLWCGLVFVLTFWVSFPSTAIVERLAYSVQDASDGDYALKATSARPWWTGLTLYDVELLAIDGDKATHLLDARSVSARTSLFSIFGSRIPVYAQIDAGSSKVNVEAGLERQGTNLRLSDLRADQAQLSINAVGAMLASTGSRLSGTGDLDLDIDLSLGVDIRDTEGRFAIRGRKMAVDLAIPDPFGGDKLFELDTISVSSLDLVVDARGGKFSLRTGELRSSIAHLDLEGDLTLDSYFNRSRIRGKAVMSELGGPLAMVESFISSAKWADGTYHWTIACTIDRFGQACFRADRERGARPTVSPGAARGALRPGLTGTKEPAAGRSRAAEVRAEREKARQERLQERRSRLETLRQGRNMPMRPNMNQPGANQGDLDDLDDYDELDNEMDHQLGNQPISPQQLLDGEQQLLPELDNQDDLSNFEIDEWD